ncbi:DUF6351 family protein [Piscinibacter koreensis]|uniref:DUF6351 domain-containing protein n=1 Tax=Piscinibacter koreensis TaxID=2742824 RepID=A0A7Y6NKI9_9BURK|nr:DUF6351 family protein [Schlegelella koreensis]NUZ04781.1 hypothetical protein [Schlegelella koreensis]
MLNRMTPPRRGRRLSRAIAAVALMCGAGAALAKPADLTVEAVSTRADLVSGGDVLVRVTLPAADNPAQAVLARNGTPLPGALHPAPDGNGWLALVSGLQLGANSLTVTSNAEVARLDVTNHPNGGPIFSGPQIQPWTCLPGALDAQCNRPVSYSYSYMPVGSTTFQTYNPASPPTNVQQITVNGQTVPYIVRVESLTQNRDGVTFAVLFNPNQPWTPWAPQAAWNKGVHVLQGAGCGTGFEEAVPGSPLNDNALRKGFLVVQISLVHNTHNCNHVVQAESVLMAKERVAEQYGLFDIIFGQGSSGGAISQLMDQNAYPGLYDGIVISHVFVDSDASRMASYDCKVVYDYWARPGTIPFTPAQREAVVGMISGCDSHVNTTRYEVYNPSVGTSCTVPAALRFDQVTNPTGVRCTLQDYEVNLVGRRPDGYANGRLDTVGLQFGLKALLAGIITPAQFVELNANIGGHDINFNRIATRITADRPGLKPLYWSGANNMMNNMSETAILETRLLATDFHQVFHAYVLRARLDRAQGHHDNHVRWRTLATTDPVLTNAAFDTMVEWLRAIKADTRNVPKAQKVIDNKPALARDRCTTGNGVDQDLGVCTRPLELTRVLAGAPDSTDVGACQLKALNSADYPGVAFTAQQWQTLQQTFPSGVCDFSKPLVDMDWTKPWMDYSGVRGKPMGPAPVSVDGRTTQVPASTTKKR